MKSTTAKVMMLVIGAAAALAGTRAAHAGDCAAVHATGSTAPGDMAACLKERPTLVLSAGGGWTLGPAGSFNYFASADVEMLKPLWLSLRARGPVHKIDAMVGLRFAGSYRVDYDFFVSSQSSSSSTMTGLRTVMRTDWVAAAGVKAVFYDGESDVGPVLQAGLQWHDSSGFGGHERIEAYVVTRSFSRWGGVLTWHNSIPTTKGLVFGMEIGYIPVDLGTVADSDAWWGIVDLGWSFEL